MLLLSPLVLLAGLLQFHFQSFLPYQGVFKGEFAFDFFTVIDIFVSILLITYLYLRLYKKVKPLRTKLPKELAICIFLLLIAGFLEMNFQQIYEPVLSQPFEYFRSLFIYPLVFAILIYQSVDEEDFKKLVNGFIFVTGIFCFVALLQYFTGIFPGEKMDFMGRLTWPYVDYITLKTSSANWVAFFVTPGFILAFILGAKKTVDKKFDHCFWIYAIAGVLAAITLYLVQSYGAYVAIFASVSLFLFRFLNFKRFLLMLVLMIMVGAGMFLVQKNSLKYQVITNQFDNYRYENSLGTREQIWKMNLNILKERPLLGIGLNQYQSYFKLNQENVLGKELNESHTPPHPHNFFMGFQANLGVLGLIAIAILLAGIFWRSKFSPENPAIFVLSAIMIHGLIDSYYWKQEIAYIFWTMIVFAYLYNLAYHKKN